MSNVDDRVKKMAYDEMVEGFVSDVEGGELVSAGVEDMYAPVLESGAMSMKPMSQLSSVKLEKVGEKVRLFFPLLTVDGSPLSVRSETFWCEPQKKFVRAPMNKELLNRALAAFDTGNPNKPCKVNRRVHTVVAVYEDLGRNDAWTSSTTVVLKTLSFGDGVLRRLQETWGYFPIGESDVVLSAPDQKAVTFKDYSVQGLPKRLYDIAPEGSVTLADRQELEECAQEVFARIKNGTSFLGVTPTMAEFMQWVEDAELAKSSPAAPQAAAAKPFGNKPPQSAALGQGANRVASQSAADGEFGGYVERP